LMLPDPPEAPPGSTDKSTTTIAANDSANPNHLSRFMVFPSF